jgi:hypothetical protein
MVADYWISIVLLLVDAIALTVGLRHKNPAMLTNNREQFYY